MKNELTTERPKVSTIESAGDVEVGQWYWVKSSDEEDSDWLGCIVQVGSNYVELHSPHSAHSGYTYTRVHIDNFFSELRHEPKAQEVIENNIAHYRNLVQRLIGEVKSITAKLGVSPHIALPDPPSNENYALAVLSSQNSVKDYESALILAKDKQLPDLFEEIKEANEDLAKWMAASSLPLQASIDGMKDMIGKIEDRVFNVSLYAGLTEQVVLCHDGEPAAFTEKLHVMQRRHYMDEECLLDYRNGGMDFQSIDQFDEWISEPVNRDRIMPFPRCLVAMRVRRQDKEREFDGTLLSAYINIRLGSLDKLTFLYIRNGEQIYRLNCDLKFGEMIFPDRASFNPHDEKMVKMFASRVDEIITKGDYDQRVKEYNSMKQKYKQWRKDNPKKTWDKSKGDWDFANPYRDVELGFGFNPGDWQPFSPNNVYYDEVSKVLSDEMKKYNRIALIIQGLFDRSPVLHPHPPVRTWTPEGFDAAVKLIYDGDSSVLYGGDKPDFQAYRQKCNESINIDSVLVGQELYWMQKEAEKENERQSRDWRVKHKIYHKTLKPYGNPGPGYLAKMLRWNKRAKQAIFRWERERTRYSYGKDDNIPCTLTVPVDCLLNISAYRTGDYKQFFLDPRTRAEYLQWAPMLLAAEEYHAGNKKV